MSQNKTSTIQSKKALTIAGFDPSSFAGLTADLRAFDALKISGFAVATSITLQTPGSFFRFEPVSENLIKEQLKLIWSEFGPFPIKIGLVPTMACRDAIVEFLDHIDMKNHMKKIDLVLDPILEASAGKGISKLRCRDLAEGLFSYATLITPNVNEAEAILGRRLFSYEDLVNAAIEIRSSYNCWVLLKGGHLIGEEVWDVLSTNVGEKIYKHTRMKIASPHGSGCLLSATIVAFCALGFDMIQAISLAQKKMIHAFSQPRFVDGFPYLSI